MDHVPRLETPFEPILVPYLGGDWDHGDFVGFPDRHPELDLKRLQLVQHYLPDQEPGAKLLQAWLFFGLIEQALQLRVEISDFVRIDAGKEWLTTSKLKDYLHRWREDHEAAKANPARLEARRLQSIAALANSLAIWLSLENFSAIVGEEVNIATQLLGNTLAHAITSVSATCRDCTYVEWVSTLNVRWRSYTTNAFLTKRMVAQGWCPSLVEKICLPNRLSLYVYSFVSLCHDP